LRFVTSLGDHRFMPNSGDLFAALDLGSNSFHLLLVRPEGKGFVVVERLKEKVQLLSGFANGEIRPEAMDRGVACLSRFAQRLRPVAADRIRVVGTCALRQAGNRDAFAARAEQILGCPVDVISGAEEARLVYLGVAHHVPRTGGRLVIDIGGGSTEFAWGEQVHAAHKVSVDVGCVALTDEHFAGLATQSTGYRAARDAARSQLAKALADVAHTPVETVFGTSGTIESVAMVLAANGWAAEGITREGLDRLEEAIVTDRWVIDAGLPGLAPDRVDIFPAGVAIVSACFDVLSLERLEYVDVSLMQGIVCDVLTESTAADRRTASVADLAERFAVDEAQANRVRRLAAHLFGQASDWWEGDHEYRELLDWAAALHELGIHIDPRHYHRHGAYILKHCDLAGLSELQQRMLALLVRGHRRSFPGLSFRAFSGELSESLMRLVAILRIAVILERSHSDADSPCVDFSVAGDSMTLSCPTGWLANHPLSARELEVEKGQLATVGLELVVEGASL
jgi:exopolyphosphatase/guanosine-5'-triphosphate,3'-diphosphate pyrophosphatase